VSGHEEDESELEEGASEPGPSIGGAGCRNGGGGGGGGEGKEGSGDSGFGVVRHVEVEVELRQWTEFSWSFFATSMLRHPHQDLPSFPTPSTRKKISKIFRTAHYLLIFMHHLPQNVFLCTTT
jgi:hypothetical protein